jgi:hypothetical protein
VVGVRLPSFDYDCCIDHIACSRYVHLKNFVGLRGHVGGWASQVLSMFSALAKYKVVKITYSSSEVAVQITKHTVIYTGLGPSLKVIAIRLAV